MTALTEDRYTEIRQGKFCSHDVKASTKIFGGSITCLGTDGYAIPGADTANLKCVGVSDEQVDNSGGSDGDKKVITGRDVYRLSCSGITVADVGKKVYVSDDQTVALSTTNSVYAGVIAEFISATEVWVDMGDVLSGA